MAFLASLSDSAKREAIARAVQADPALREGCYQGHRVVGLTLDEAMAETGGGFEATTAPLGALLREGTAPVASHVAVLNGTRPIAVVSQSYGLVQHSEVAEALRPILDRGDALIRSIDLRDGGARFDAYALLGYSAVQRIGRDRPDALAHMLRVGNAHDGSSAAWAAIATRCLTCDNGMGFTVLDGTMRVRHTSQARTRIPDLQASLALAMDAAERETAELAELGQQPMAAAEFVEFAATLLGEVRGAPTTEKGQRRRESDVEALLALFEGGRGNVGASRMDALMALTEWLTPRREAYRDAARYATAYYANESGGAARTREAGRRMLVNRARG